MDLHLILPRLPPYPLPLKEDRNSLNCRNWALHHKHKRHHGRITLAVPIRCRQSSPRRRPIQT